jgi:hypothetical protein
VHADHYSRLSPTTYPGKNSLEKEPFLEAAKEGGMPLFNPMLAFLFFHSFQRLNNMYAYLGPRDGQSYDGVLERKITLPNTQRLLSDEFIITEHTIALFQLYVASSLDSGIALKRKKATFIL